METIGLPQGGGAIAGIDESASSNSASGAAQCTFSLPIPKGRSGFGPALALEYDSGGGNGPFGLGFSVKAPAISRRTDKGVPRYDSTDRFVSSATGEIVATLTTKLVPDTAQRTVGGITYEVAQYRPRVEGAPMRIERWADLSSGAEHWRTISTDNVTTLFGSTPQSRIADPADPRRVVSWLADQVTDATGNMLVYTYKSEDGAGVDAGRSYEKNRASAAGYAQRYLKSAAYGNATPFVPGGWLFQVLFDYGEHDAAAPTPAEAQTWPVRNDPFSTYRSGFEVRTYRLCRRVLAFHTFTELGGTTLTQSLNFTYDANAEHALLTEIQSFGYKRKEGGYTSASLPPVSLTYSQRTIDDVVQTIDPDSAGNLTLTRPDQCMWVDLYREGLTGILTATGSDWHYKRNLGGGKFAPLTLVSSFPSLAEVPSFRDIRFADVDGDGGLELVSVHEGRAGFQRLNDDGWGAFQPFVSWPSVSPRDPNLRMFDVDGDGRADLLLTGDAGLSWYRSLGDAGFAPEDTAPRAYNEEAGPAVTFAEEVQTIFLADMSGDGLTDIVRIRNGEIAYWPNLGYGRFGPKVTMSNAPLFDDPDSYDSARIRLSDIDGTGCADLIYLGRTGAKLFFNQSGNGWSDAALLGAFPPIDDVSTAAVVDLLGAGTAAIAWWTLLPPEPGAQLRYIDLLGSTKPHLLVSMANNLGRVVNLTYGTSTSFYLADEAAGTPWVSKIPFVVHVLTSVDTFDNITQRRYVSRSTYHHGFYDVVEREFAGFGRIDRYDTDTVENFVLSGASNIVESDVMQPPVYTRTWRHPGSVPSAIDPVDRFATEYFRGGSIGAPRSSPGPDPNLPIGEWMQHFYALRGAVLRQEVYANDATPLAFIPYSVTENTYKVDRRQATGPNPYAVFTAYGLETISYNCERNASDPRINHRITLAIDDASQVRREAHVTYGRVTADSSLPLEVTQAQQRIHVSYAEADFTNDVDTDDAYRLRSRGEARGWDITGINPSGTFFDPAELDAKITGATVIDFSATPTGAAERRLVSRARYFYLADDLSGPLALGTQGALGLLSSGVTLAFTSTLVTQIYGTKATDAIMAQAGYVHSQGDSDWWAPTGEPVYAHDAASHFCRATGFADPFGNVVTTAYDSYDLLPVSVTDPFNNVTSCTNDYRILKPTLMTDANGNRTAVAVDELGFVTALAQMGKSGSTGNDTLSDPTQRFEYDAYRWMNLQLPVVSRSYARERRGDPTTPWHTSYAYSDGGGKLVMTKIEAAPGVANVLKPDGTLTQVDTTPNPRYIGNGRTVVNNKGNPIRQYEPYFSASSEYEDAKALVEIGFSPTYYYDPLGRMTRIEFADGTIARTSFTAWSQQSADQNDTVLSSSWYAALGSPDPNGPEPTDPQQRAAWLAAKCANTPGVSIFDSLGRTVYAIADNGPDGKFGARIDMDGPRTRTTLIDPLGRTASDTRTNVPGQTISSTTLDRPTRLVLPDVQGKPFYVWDGTARAFRYSYDAARRPLALYQSTGGGEIAVSVTLYGDLRSDGATDNLRTRVAAVCDQAGLVQMSGYDLAGKTLSVTRTFAQDYSAPTDWSAVASATKLADALTAAAAKLEHETFTTSFTWDALARATSITLPDASVFTPAYDLGNHLDTLDLSIGGGAKTRFISAETHDARGRRLTTTYGNNTISQLQYDAIMGRLTGMRLTRTSDSAKLQDRTYFYDAFGNIASCSDAAQQTVYFKNAVVPPTWKYVYDAIYQLRSASGREHAGGSADTQTNWTDLPVNTIPNVNDASAVRTYTQTYTYDAVGNIQQMAHAAAGGSWTRSYAYDAASNRLTGTSLPGDPSGGPYSAKYTYDAFGNMTSMPNAATMDWNAYDQLQRVDLGGGGTAYYVYDGQGQRARKVIVNGSLVKDRKCVGLFEVYREKSAATLKLERKTLHVTESNRRVAQIDVTTVDTSGAIAPGSTAIRYQYQDAVGSCALTCDENGAVVTYEEFHPFGTTAYRASSNDAETSLKRYRFIDRGRDDETGMYCSGVRYYIPWLGRWSSPDPGGFMGTFNLYAYVSNRPTSLADPSGFGPPKSGTGEVEWIVPPEITTVKRFETWARSAGIRYTGTPSYSAEDHVWSVDSWEKVRKGQGGVVNPPTPAAPTGGGGGGTPTTPPADTAAAADSTAGATNNAAASGSGNTSGGNTGGGGSTGPDLNTGNIQKYRDQPPAVYDPDTGARLTENEHIVQGQALKDLSNTGAGSSLYDDTSYNNNMTLRLDRDTSVAKTNLDMQYLRDMRSGNASSSLGDVGEAYRQNTLDAIAQTGSTVTEEEVNTAYLSQMGEVFSTTPLNEVMDHLPPAPSIWTSVGTFATGMTGALARNLIPGFAEAETAVWWGGVRLVAAYGTEGVLGSLGSAMVAAPGAVVGTALAAGAGGYLVGGAIGHAVEDATGSKAAGVGAGVLAGAGTGALIGAAIGSIVPGLGTAVGAGIGAVVGAIGGFIGSFW